MKISEMEKRQITEKASFLLEKGYRLFSDNNSIQYSNSNDCISIVYPPNAEISEMNIKFFNRNETFSIGWIAYVRENLRLNPHNKLENIIGLLEYVKINYNQITNYRYCKDSSKLIDDFIKQNKK